MSSSSKGHALFLFSATSASVGDSKYNMLKKGDLIRIKRKYYWHWAVYYGRRTVIHVINDHKEEGICIARIDFESLDSVLSGNKFKIGNKKDSKWTPFPPDEIIERAKRSIGTFTYNIVTDNCEHFARWCRYGVDYSNQANILKSLLPDKYFQILLKRSYEDLTEEEKNLITRALENIQTMQNIFRFSGSRRKAPIESLAKGATNETNYDSVSTIGHPEVTGNTVPFMERQKTPLH